MLPETASGPGIQAKSFSILLVLSIDNFVVYGDSVSYFQKIWYYKFIV